eukprot:2866516-Pyramimonas_sp.AAC.1
MTTAGDEAVAGLRMLRLGGASGYTREWIVLADEGCWAYIRGETLQSSCTSPTSCLGPVAGSRNPRRAGLLSGCKDIRCEG